MFFKAVMSHLFEQENRQVSKRTEEVMAPLNLKALYSYSEKLQNERKTAHLLSHIFSGSIQTEAANSRKDHQKVVNG